MISCTDDGTTPLAGMRDGERLHVRIVRARGAGRRRWSLPCRSARRPSGRAESARRPRWRGWRDTRCRSSSRRRGNHCGRSRRPRRLRGGRSRARLGVRADFRRQGGASRPGLVGAQEFAFGLVEAGEQGEAFAVGEQVAGSRSAALIGDALEPGPAHGGGIGASAAGRQLQPARGQEGWRGPACRATA